MQQEHGQNSQDVQPLDTVSYVNKQIQEGARVTVNYRHSTSLGLDWPVQRVGTDFVALLTDSGKEKVIPRTAISEFVVTKPTRNARS